MHGSRFTCAVGAAVGLTMVVVAHRAGEGLPSGGTRATEVEMARAVGSNPSYTYLSSGEICSASNLDNSNQVPQYGCSGNPGVTCIACKGVGSVSGIYGGLPNRPSGTVTPNGASALSCSSQKKWYGTCSQGPNYYCDATINSYSDCAGTYEPYAFQLGG